MIIMLISQLYEMCLYTYINMVTQCCYCEKLSHFATVIHAAMLVEVIHYSSNEQ